MSDDPREATAGDGLSAERVKELRERLRVSRQASDEVPFGVSFDCDDYGGTYDELGALLDAHGALQAAREQLDEVRREASEQRDENARLMGLLYSAPGGFIDDLRCAREALDAAERERDAVRAELKAAMVHLEHATYCDGKVWDCDYDTGKRCEECQTASAYLAKRRAGGGVDGRPR